MKVYDKKARNHNIIVIVLMLITFFSFLISCNDKEKSSNIEEESMEQININDDITQLEVDYDEPLTIFFESYGVLLNFQRAYPDIKFNAYHITTLNTLGDGELELYVAKHGDPDIILIQNTPEHNQRIEEWYQKGLVADMRSFLVEDQDITESDYIPGTFDALDNGEALLGIPLSWRMRGLVVRESKVAESALALLSDEYTGEELFGVLLEEVNKRENGEEFFWEDFWANSIIGILLDVNAIQEDDNGEIVIDEELFKTLYDFHMKNYALFNRIKPQFKNRHPGAAVLNPEIHEGQYFAAR